MKSFFLSVATIFLITLGMTAPAQADYNIWKDSATGLSLSWPDNWKQVSNADPDDLITVMAPSGRAHATCRARARDDARYLIYPPEYSSDIQKISYSTPFWEQYLAEYSDHEIYDIRDGAGLGRGFAGYAIANFESAVQGPNMKRKGLIFASLYNGKTFIIECSSHEDAFANWKGTFLSIAKSVDFQKAHHELRSGHYRPFMSDPRIEFPSDRGNGRVLY